MFFSKVDSGQWHLQALKTCDHPWKTWSAPGGLCCFPVFRAFGRRSAVLRCQPGARTGGKGVVGQQVCGWGKILPGLQRPTVSLPLCAFMYRPAYTWKLERYDVSTCFISISMHYVIAQVLFITFPFKHTGFRRTKSPFQQTPHIWLLSSADLTNQMMLHTWHFQEWGNYSGWFITNNLPITINHTSCTPQKSNMFNIMDTNMLY